MQPSIAADLEAGEPLPAPAPPAERARDLIVQIDATATLNADRSLSALSNALASIPWGIVITDAAGIIEFANARFADMAGYGPGELCGASASILRRNGRIEEGSMLDALARGDSWHAEFPGRAKGGEEFWLAIAVSPIFDEEGTLAHVLAIAHDITRCKRAQQHSRLVPASPPDHMVVADLDGTILFVDRTVPGLSREEAIGASVYDFVPREDHERLTVYMREAVETRACFTYEIASVGPHGTTVDYVVRVGPIEREGKAVALSFVTTAVAKLANDEETPDAALPIVDRLPQLSHREMQVLELLARGSTNREVAAQLRLSRRTIDHHVGHILNKLEAPNRTAAVVAAEQVGLLPLRREFGIGKITDAPRVDTRVR